MMAVGGVAVAVAAAARVVLVLGAAVVAHLAAREPAAELSPFLEATVHLAAYHAVVELRLANEV